jgi:GAF domain-containing protein/CheY-like chemotaxis protein
MEAVSSWLDSRVPADVQRLQADPTWPGGGGVSKQATSVSPRILLVDDNADDRAVIERSLRQGFPDVGIEHVGLPGDLARALERGEFDLVITDYHLHWTSGLSVLLAAKERDPDLPVVMYTGVGSEEIAVEVMRAGLDDYVLKSPEHRVRLVAAVKAALARAAERRQLRNAEDEIRGLARFTSENPNPVLRLGSEGRVIYANEASDDVLASWECTIGQQAPAPWPEIVRQALANGDRGMIEVRSGHRIYSFTVTPIADAGYVNLYGADVTERVHAEGELKRRDDILEAVAFAVEQLLKSGRWQEVIPVVLERLGRSVGVSRAYLFESHFNPEGEPVVSQRFEWVAAGVSPQIDNPVMQGIPQFRGPIARWFRLFRRGEPFYGKVHLLPEEERDALRGQGIQSIAVVPIILEGGLWGVLGFDDWWAEREWAAQEIEALRLAAGTLGAAIQRRRSEDVMARRAREMSALYQTSLEITSRVRLPELLEIIVRRASDLVGVPMGGLYLLQPDGKSLRLVVSHNLPRNYTGACLQLGEGLSGRVAESGETLAVEDYRSWSGRAAIFEDAAFRRVLGVPLKRGGQVIGVINVTDPERVGAFDPEDVRLITLLADQAAIAIENSRLLEHMERSAREMNALYQTSLELDSRVGLPALLETIVRRAANLIGASMGGMYLMEPGGKELRCVISCNLPSEYVGNRLALGEGLAGRVAESGKTIAVEDYRSWEGRATIYTDAPFRRVLGVPLKRGGQVIGVIDVVDTDRTGPYQPEEVRLITLLADQAAIAIENSQLLEETERRAQEMDALYQTSLEFTSQVPLKDLMTLILVRACKLLEASNGTLYVMRPDGQTLDAAVQYNLPAKHENNTRRIGEGLSGRAAQTGELTLTADYSAEGWGQGLYDDLQIGRALAVPLKRMGRVIGVLSLGDMDRTGDFKREEIRLVNLFADQAAIAVETGRLIEEIQRRSAYLEAVTSTSKALRVARSRSDMLPIILDQLLALTNAEGSVIALLDESGTELVTALGRGSWSEVTGQRQPAGSGLMGAVMATRASQVLSDASQDPRLLRPELLAGQNAMALVPLIVEDDVIGVVGIGRETPFASDEVHILAAIAEMAANAIHRAGATETLERRVRERTLELQASNKRLSELDRLKSEFVSNVSHELRAPIANILLYLDLIGQPGRADRQATYLGILKGEAERLRDLIEDLLMLSRIERGALPLEAEPHALNPLIAEVVAAHAARASAKLLRIQHEPDPRLPVVWVDRAEIQQVFTNLVANAVAYSPRGGIVEVRGEQKEHRGRPHVAVSVHNDGPPIHRDDLPHLFERFFRGRNASHNGEPGTGLGLAICKEIVERHQGWIEVDSQEGAGTTFTVWLPVHPETGPRP